jgi:hypothetical protein
MDFITIKKEPDPFKPLRDRRGSVSAEEPRQSWSGSIKMSVPVVTIHWSRNHGPKVLASMNREVLFDL